MNFLNPIDIANRACQHCGVVRISATQGFSENSVQAGEFGFNYDKLRRAELRRNVWAFATRKVALRAVTPTTMFLSPAMWVSTTTYTQGAIVSDASGYLWQSRAQDNLNNTPGNTSAWEAYCGPLTADAFDTTGTTGYYAGELVYETPGDGTYVVYLSLTNNNSLDPSTPTAWDSTVQYMKDQVVELSSTFYVSLIDFNLNQSPSSAPALWASGTTYGAAASVGASDGLIYTSIAGGNIGNDPTSTTGLWTNTGVLNPWTTVNPFGQAGDTWLVVDVALQDFSIVYPIGSGASFQSVSRNFFRLPANYLRRAPADPKAGSQSFLGAPTGVMYTDWLYEGDFIISRQAFPIILRFVADITQVTAMDDMFCEGLAATLALNTINRLTQATGKKADIANDYRRVMGEARTINGIETGPTEAEEDLYLTCRI